MKIGIDIDNVISNFNNTLLEEYLLHDKTLRNSGVINKNADYISWIGPKMKNLLFIKRI